MAELGRLWAGRLYGTNTGNLFISLDSAGDDLSGTLRFLDSVFGIVVYEITGKFDGSTVELNGAVKQGRPDVEYGTIKATAVLTPQGRLQGEWESTLGTGGTFELFPHDLAPADQTKSGNPLIPEQLYTARRSVNAVRIYDDDVRQLAQAIRKDFLAGRLVVTFKTSDGESTRYFEDFEGDPQRPAKLQYLKLTIQEPEAHGINKIATIELDSKVGNQVSVQGIYESWVIGKAEALVRHIRQYEKSLFTNAKKFGIGLNQLILVAMLVLFPEVEPLWRRAAFAGIVIGLLGGLVWFHWRYLPNVVIYLTPRKPGVIERAWPTLLSWLVGATASLAAAFAFYWLTKN